MKKLQSSTRKERSFNERAQRRIAFVNRHFLIRATLCAPSPGPFGDPGVGHGRFSVPRIAGRVEPSDGLKAPVPLPINADRLQWQAPREPRMARRSRAGGVAHEDEYVRVEGMACTRLPKELLARARHRMAKASKRKETTAVPRQDPCSCDVVICACQAATFNRFRKADADEWRFRGAGLRR